MERRNTVQKQIVLNAVRALHSHVTAETVYNYVKKEHPTIGKGTVYRNLGILAENGEIRRVEIPNGPDCYDFTLEDHYHCRCVCCGAVEDVDLAETPELLRLVKDTHGMKFLGYDILFKVICPSCRDSQERREDVWTRKQCTD